MEAEKQRINTEIKSIMQELADRNLLITTLKEEIATMKQRMGEMRKRHKGDIERREG
jgi:uncharacterized protein (UPF0335 family)